MPLPAHALRKLGRDLALVRRKRGISPSDMAARLFVSRDTLWRLERGDPTIALGTCLRGTTSGPTWKRPGEVNRRKPIRRKRI